MTAGSDGNIIDLPAVPIASLDPTQHLPNDHALKAEVALIWPYSSSTKSAAILVAELDPCLRRDKGQVRVQLHGIAAEAVGASRVQIGDHVSIALAGARWAETRSSRTASSRTIDGELSFDAILNLQVRARKALRGCKTRYSISLGLIRSRADRHKITRNGSQFATIDVRKPTSSSPARAIAQSPDTPFSLSRPLPALSPPKAWSSPAFVRQKSSLIRPAIRPAFTARPDPLPFSTDDPTEQELDNDKPRKRTKFGRKSGE